MAVILLFVLIKNGQIFDLGILFRSTLVPQQAANSLLSPPNDIETVYQQLLVENSNLRLLEKENEELREFLNFKEKTNYQLVLTNIISRDPVNNNIVMINAGQKEGLAKGQAVVVNNGIIVAKIIEVSPDSAKFRLLTDNFSKLAVNIGPSQKIGGVLTGILGLGMNLSYIPQEQELKKKDLVTTAGADTKIPAGLIIGQIENIHFSEEELFKNASVSSLVDYNTLGIVGVIISL